MILFHSGFSLFSGGFLGVDVFFVISGYLITSIILNAKRAGEFSFAGFYERRARRILPALYLTLILSSGFAFFFLLPSQLAEFGQSIISTVTFSANIFFWLKTDYWAQAADLTPLIHLWSLGVEEQFYFFFPLFLVLMKKERHSYLILFVAAVVSFGTMLYLTRLGNVTEAFYLLPFRLWELAAGAIGVFWRRPVSDRTSNLLNLTALAGLGTCFVIFSEKTNPALLRCVPVAATCLILVTKNKSGLAKHILANRVMVYVGLISYSLYLFHQPTLVFLRLAFFNMLGAGQICLGFLITFGLAAFSYRFVERPFKDRKRFSRRMIYAVSGLTSVLLLVYGWILHRTEGAKNYQLLKMNAEANQLFLRFEEANRLRANVLTDLLPKSTEEFAAGNKPKILFVGDSLSEDLFIAASLSKGAADGYQVRRIGLDDECIRNLPSGNYGVGLSFVPCRVEIKAFLGSSLLRDSEVIVIALAWLSNANYLGTFLTLSQIKGKQIIVYETHGFADMSSFLLYLNRSKLSFTSKEFKRFAYQSRHQRTLTANKTLDKIAKQLGLTTINAFDFFCDSSVQECTVIDDTGPLIVDAAHLSGGGLTKISPWLSERLIDATIFSAGEALFRQ